MTKRRTKIADWFFGRSIAGRFRPIDLAALIVTAVIVTLWIGSCTGCAAPPARETVRTPAEIHAEGLAHGPNLRDWPFDLAYEFRQAHYVHVGRGRD